MSRAARYGPQHIFTAPRLRLQAASMPGQGSGELGLLGPTGQCGGASAVSADRRGTPGAQVQPWPGPPVSPHRPKERPSPTARCLSVGLSVVGFPACPPHPPLTEHPSLSLSTLAPQARHQTRHHRCLSPGQSSCQQRRSDPAGHGGSATPVPTGQEETEPRLGEGQPEPARPTSDGGAAVPGPAALHGQLGLPGRPAWRRRAHRPAKTGSKAWTPHSVSKPAPHTHTWGREARGAGAERARPPWQEKPAQLAPGQHLCPGWPHTPDHASWSHGATGRCPHRGLRRQGSGCACVCTREHPPPRALTRKADSTWALPTRAHFPAPPGCAVAMVTRWVPTQHTRPAPPSPGRPRNPGPFLRRTS